MPPESRIISIKDVDDKVNLLVYGDSGVGKTQFAGSDDRVLFVAPEDNSDGLLSAVLAGSTADKWPIDRWDDLSDAFNYLHHLDKIPYNWVVIDSLTEMQMMAMRGILDSAVAENPARDPDIPQLQDWQKYYEMVKRMIKAFNALDVNVLYTALARVAEDTDGEEYLLPDLQGKKDNYAKQVSSWMTSFGYMSVKRKRVSAEGEKAQFVDERRITWRDTGLIKGKDRTNALAPYTILEGPHPLKDIRLAIEAKKNGVTTPVQKKNSSARTVSSEKKEEDSAEAEAL